MRRITTVVVSLAVLATATPTAVPQTEPAAPAPKPQLRNGCAALVTQKEHRQYATKVYLRTTISKKAQRKLKQMRLCQHTAKAGRNTRKVERRLAQLRWARSCGNHNPTACAYDAARHHGVSAAWLISCARTEGGLDANGYRRPNESGSDATGNWQFMPRTFWAYVGRSGAPKPWIYLSSEDQAYTAAYMFKIGQSGQWTGKGC